MVDSRQKIKTLFGVLREPDIETFIIEKAAINFSKAYSCILLLLAKTFNIHSICLLRSSFRIMY